MEQTLVSNTGQAAGTAALVGTDGTDTFVQAQAFTTGTDPHGFTLTKVTVNIGGYASGDAFTAAIHSNSTAGQPGSSLYSLTNPSSIADGSIDLTAPADGSIDLTAPGTKDNLPPGHKGNDGCNHRRHNRDKRRGRRKPGPLEHCRYAKRQHRRRLLMDEQRH